MAKCLLCIGSPMTEKIINAFEGNIGGIELLGCPYTSKLERAVNSAGSLNKIIIFEKGIDGEISDIVKNNSYDVIFVLKTESLMQEYDIKYCTNKNIKIVKKQDSVTQKFIEDLVAASEIEDWLLYKSENLMDAPQESQPQEEPTTVEQPAQAEPEVVTPTKRTLEKETLGGEASLFDEFEKVNNSNINIDDGPAMQVPQKVEQKPISPVIHIEDNPKQRIINILNLFKDGCIITFTGTPKSYSSTTAFNVARTFADCGATTLLIDLDTKNYGLSTLNKETYKLANQSKEFNKLQEAFRTKKIITNTIRPFNNLMVLTNSYACDGFDLDDKWVKMIHEAILANRTTFKIVILDVKLKDLDVLSSIVQLGVKTVFNVSATNKDFLDLAKKVQELKDDTLKTYLFKNSAYLLVNSRNSKLLNTDNKDLAAIDTYLNDEYGIIQKDRQYGSIPKIGDIMEDITKTDALLPCEKLNYLEMQKFILRMFGDNV